MTYRIFIVEDDPTIALAMQKHIESWGFDVHCAVDFLRVEEEFTEFDPQLVILDILLPFYNGYHWCQKIRERSKVPIVFLSSASDNMNLVLAMNLGADDFIAKPFDLTVLSAKITAILRRASAVRLRYGCGRRTTRRTHIPHPGWRKNERLARTLQKCKIRRGNCKTYRWLAHAACAIL